MTRVLMRVLLVALQRQVDVVLVRAVVLIQLIQVRVRGLHLQVLTIHLLLQTTWMILTSISTLRQQRGAAKLIGVGVAVVVAAVVAADAVAVAGVVVLLLAASPVRVLQALQPLRTS